MVKNPNNNETVFNQNSGILFSGPTFSASEKPDSAPKVPPLLTAAPTFGAPMFAAAPAPAADNGEETPSKNEKASGGKRKGKKKGEDGSEATSKISKGKAEKKSRTSKKSRKSDEAETVSEADSASKDARSARGDSKADPQRVRRLVLVNKLVTWKRLAVTVGVEGARALVLTLVTKLSKLKALPV